MKGIVLGFDTVKGGVIRAEDSKRYALQTSAWRGSEDPYTGQEVDFEVDGETASDVYPLKKEHESSPGDVGTMLLSAGKSIAAAASRATDEASYKLSDSSSHPIAQKIIGKEKLLSAWMFALILICFFLPFASISAGNQLAQFSLDTSVLKMMIGTTMSLPKLNFLSVQMTDTQIPGDSKVALIFIATAIGLGINVMTVRKSALISAGVGVFGLTQILSSKFNIDSTWSRLNGVGGMLANVSYGVGFWGSAILFVLVSFLNIWLFFRTRGAR
jgi:hypothetical protein